MNWFSKWLPQPGPSRGEQCILRLIDLAALGAQITQLLHTSSGTDCRGIHQKVGDAGTLVDIIHKFHDGTARKLYIFYQNPSEYVVAYAVSEKLIELSDVPEQLRDAIRTYQDSFREQEDTEIGRHQKIKHAPFNG